MIHGKNFHWEDAKEPRINSEDFVKPERTFSEIRVPKLSENSSIDETVKETVTGIAERFVIASLMPPTISKEEISQKIEEHSGQDINYRTIKNIAREMMGDVPRFLCVVSDSAERRNVAAASIRNYICDCVDYRNQEEGDTLDLHVLNIDAKHTLSQKVPNKRLDEDGAVQSLVPLESPYAQRNQYIQKLDTAKQLIKDNNSSYLLMLPDIDEVMSDGPRQGINSDGKYIVGQMEKLEKNQDNFMVITTLKPDHQILYGDARHAGFEKMYNLKVNLDYEF